MNIPADFPSADQENVYYSIKALFAEFSKYFETAAIKALNPLLEEFYYPTFVFDDSNAPTSYQLDVYPREGSKETVLLSETGSILLQKGNKQPAVAAPKEESLNDGAQNIKLDSTFYSTAKLKSSDFFTELEEDFETMNEVDLLVGTKFWYDSKFASQKLQFLDISKNIVKSAFKTMPKKELQALKDNFTNINQQIDDTVGILSDIKQGQALSLDALKYENLVSDSYNFSSTVQNSYSGLRGTKVNVAQSIIDLTRSNPGPGSGMIRKGKIISSGNYEEKIVVTGKSNIRNPFYSYQKLWNTVLTRLKENGYISKSSLESATESLSSPLLISDLPPEILSVLKFSANGSGPRDIFDDNGWLKTWYYDNFAQKIIGKDPDFSTLDEFSSRFSSLSEEAIALSDQILLGGSFVLVNQAIMKAILRLCQTGVDVSEYAPMSGTETIFAKMGRSAALGPSQCHQFPSKFVQDEESYKIDPFTKTGFLCYHSIICILRSIFDNDSAVKNWVKSNMVKFDSDHDKTIKLWDAISDYGQGAQQSHAKQPDSAQSGKTYTSRNATLKMINHLYTIDETFTHKDIYLVGAGDERVAAAERTYIQWCIPCLDHHLESTIVQSGNMPEDNEVKPYHKDNEAAVSDEGYIRSYDTDTAYKLMGWMGAAEDLSSTTTTHAGQTSVFKRNKKVHYGWYDNTWDSEDKNNNTWDFWKQKNWSMPYFWAATMSLCKGIVVEAGRSIIESIKEITGTDFELSVEEIVEILPIDDLWICIERTQEKLRNMNALYLRSYVMVDGNISFCEVKEAPNTTRIWNPDYRNTSGGRTKDLIRNYVKFVALCSEKNSIQVVEDNEEIVFDYATYLPPETLAENTNLNFKNGHGGFQNYISTDFDPYYDVLTFRKIEFIDEVPVKKNMTPIGIENEFLNLYQSYISSCSVLWGHVNMHSKILQALTKFKSFIEGFEINDNAKVIFAEGHFDASSDIQNPDALIGQIKNNIKLYQPDEQGIRNDWNSITLDTIDTLKDDILYVYVLGLKKSLWESADSTITIIPQYYGSEGAVEISAAEHVFNYYKQNDASSIEDPLLKSNELISKDIIDYMHVVRGIDCNELVFSSKVDSIYDELIINSESGIFPWTSDDFEEGKPTKQIDTLFNISPWVFSRNYFYDICLENEYQRVVGVVLRRSQLEAVPVDTLDSETSLDDIIGSIRWIVKGG